MDKRIRYILIGCVIVLALILLFLTGWKIIADGRALQTEKNKVASLNTKINTLKDNKALETEKKKNASLAGQIKSLEGQLNTANNNNADQAPAYPSTPEDLIREYYKAVNAKNYGTAWTFGIPGIGWFKTIDDLAISYADYVSTVEVTGVTALGVGGQSDTKKAFSVSFNATYIKPYPGGSHKLPGSIWVTKDGAGNWKIESIGSGI
jgi:hypothetical protein